MHYQREWMHYPGHLNAREAAMYVAVLEEFSTITSKGQTTVPKSIRRALGVEAGDQIAFRIDNSGVTIRRASEDRNDPAVEAFLTFLAKDIQTHPGAIKAITPDLSRRLAEITEGIEVDLDAPIDGDVAL
jgi:antitoxin PrlF